MKSEIVTRLSPFFGRLSKEQRSLKSISHECKMDQVTDEQSTRSEVKKSLFLTFSYLCSYGTTSVLFLVLPQ